jgi:hypothetical protein
VHAAVGRQREDLDQRLGLAQPPRAIGHDVVADGDRETAQQADARLGAIARGSPLPDEPNASTRGRRARRRSPRTGAARGPRHDRPRHARAGRRRAEMRSPTGRPHQAQRSARAPCRCRAAPQRRGRPGADHQRAHRTVVILQRDTHPPPLSHGCGRPQRLRRGARSGRAARPPAARACAPTSADVSGRLTARRAYASSSSAAGVFRRKRRRCLRERKRFRGGHLAFVCGLCHGRRKPAYGPGVGEVRRGLTIRSSCAEPRQERSGGGAVTGKLRRSRRPTADNAEEASAGRGAPRRRRARPRTPGGRDCARGRPAGRWPATSA